MDIPIRWADNTADLKRSLLDGIDTITAMKSAVDKTANALGGTGLLAAANKTAAAIQQIGGVTKLTASEQERASALIDKAIEKYKVLGAEAPSALRSLSEELKKGTEATGGWLPILQEVGNSWAARIAEGMLLRDAIREVISTVKDAALALPELALKGAGIADVEENFTRLTSQAGLLGTALMGTLREGTHNTVTNFELMKTVNKDLAAGLNLTEAQFGTLSKGAFALAQATGVDVKSALETMNEALVSGKEKAVGQLVGIQNIKKGEEEYAKSLGSTVEGLTEEGKLQAKRAGILYGVEQATKTLGDQTDGLDERVAQLQTTWTNFQEDLGKTLATSAVLEAGMSGLKTAFEQALGGTQETAIKQITTAVDSLLIEIVGLGKVGVVSAGFLIKEWSATKIVYLNVAQAVDDVHLAIVLAQRAAALGILPGSADLTRFKELTTQANALYETIKTRRQAMIDEKASQDNVNASTDKSLKILDDLKAKMEAARAGEVAFVGPLEDVANAHARDAKAAADAATARANLVKQGSEEKSALKAYEKAWNDANAAETSAIDTVKAMNAQIVGTVKYYLDAGRGVDQLAIMFPKLTKSQLEAIKAVNDLESAYKKLDVDQLQVIAAAVKNEQSIQLVAKAYNINQRAAEDFAKSLKKIDEIERGGKLFDYEGLQALGQKMHVANDEFYQAGLHLQAITHYGSDAFNGLDKIGQVTTGFVKNVKNLGTDLSAVLGDVAKSFTQMATIGGDSFGPVLRDIGMAVEAGKQLSDVMKLAASFTADNAKNNKSGFDAGQIASLAAGWVGVASAIWSVYSALDSASKKAAELERARVAAQHLADDFHQATVFSDDLGKSIQDTADHLATMKNLPIIAIDPNFAENLQAQYDKIGTQAMGKSHEISQQVYQDLAEALHLPEVLKQLGDTSLFTAEQLKTVTRQFGELMATAKVGGAIGTDAVKSLDSSLVQFGNDAIASGGLVSQLFLDTVAGADKAGIALQNTGKFLVDQMKGAGSGLNALLTGLAGSAKAAGGELQVTSDQAAGLGAAIAGTFAGLMDKGVGFKDSLAAIQPALDTLNQTLDGTGINGGIAFTMLGAMADIAADKVTGPLVDAISGANEALKGLHNSGILNQEMFQGVTSSALDAYNTIIAQGKDGQAALALMQPELQTAWELEQKFGYQADTGTQALIDQGVAAGIVGEQNKSAMDQVLDVLKAIGKALGADLPGDAEKAKKSLDNIAIAANNIPTSRTFHLITVTDAMSPQEQQDAALYNQRGIADSVPALDTSGLNGDSNNNPGYARGSGGLVDFGPGTDVTLHGKEAVVTEGDWWDMKAGGGVGLSTAALERQLGGLREDMALRDRRQPQLLAVAIRNALRP